MLASFSSSSKGTGGGRGRGIEGLARRSVSCSSTGSERSQIWAMRVPRVRRHARRGGMIHGSDGINTHPRTSWSHRAAPCGTRQAARQPRVCPRSRPGERGRGKGWGEVSHQTGEGTRFRSARRGGARTSSTRRKWSTTERSTRGCTTTSSYCPRGLTTSTLAAIVVACLSPVANGYGRVLGSRRQLDREEKSWKRRARENAGADCVRGTVRSAVHTRAEHRTISHSPRGHTR